MRGQVEKATGGQSKGLELLTYGTRGKDTKAARNFVQGLESKTALKKGKAEGYRLGVPL